MFGIFYSYCLVPFIPSVPQLSKSWPCMAVEVVVVATVVEAAVVVAEVVVTAVVAVVVVTEAVVAVTVVVVAAMEVNMARPLCPLVAVRHDR